MSNDRSGQDRLVRVARLAKILARTRMHTALHRELSLALEESELIGGRRERQRCVAWLEALPCQDDGIRLLLTQIAARLNSEH